MKNYLKEHGLLTSEELTKDYAIPEWSIKSKKMGTPKRGDFLKKIICQSSTEDRPTRVEKVVTDINAELAEMRKALQTSNFSYSLKHTIRNQVDASVQHIEQSYEQAIKYDGYVGNKGRASREKGEERLKNLLNDLHKKREGLENIKELSVNNLNDLKKKIDEQYGPDADYFKSITKYSYKIDKKLSYYRIGIINYHWQFSRSCKKGDFLEAGKWAKRLMDEKVAYEGYLARIVPGSTTLGKANIASTSGGQPEYKITEASTSNTKNTLVNKLNEIDQEISRIKPKDVRISRMTWIGDALIRNSRDHRPERVKKVIEQFKTIARDINNKIGSDYIPENLRDELAKTTLFLIKDFCNFPDQAVLNYGKDGGKGREARNLAEKRIEELNDQLKTLSDATSIYKQVHEIQAKFIEVLSESNKEEANREVEKVDNAFEQFLLDHYEQGNNRQTSKQIVEESYELLKDIVKKDIDKEWNKYTDFYQYLGERARLAEKDKNSKYAEHAKLANSKIQAFTLKTLNSLLNHSESAYQEGDFTGVYKYLEKAREQLSRLSDYLDMWKKVKKIEAQIKNVPASSSNDAISRSVQLVTEKVNDFKQADTRFLEQLSSSSHSDELIQNAHKGLQNAYQPFEILDNFSNVIAVLSDSNIKEHTNRAIDNFNKDFNQFLDLYAQGNDLPASKQLVEESYERLKGIVRDGLRKKWNEHERSHKRYLENTQLDKDSQVVDLYKEKIDVLRKKFNRSLDEENFVTAREYLKLIENRNKDFDDCLHGNKTLRKNIGFDTLEDSREVDNTETISEDHVEPKSDNIPSERVPEEYKQFNKLLEEIDKKLDWTGFDRKGRPQNIRFLSEEVEAQFIDTVYTFTAFPNACEQAIDSSDGDEGRETRNQNEEKIKPLNKIMEEMSKDLDKWQEVHKIKEDLISVPEEDRPRVEELANKEVAIVEEAYKKVLDCYQRGNDWSLPKKHFEDACRSFNTIVAEATKETAQERHRHLLQQALGSDYD